MKNSITAAALAVTFSAALVSGAQAAEYKIDPAHTTVTFSIRHVVSKVRGQFNTVEGSFNYDPKDLKKASGSFTIDAASVDTHTPKRDADLRSPNFFDVEKFKTLTFVVTSVTQKGTDLKVNGDLTIHGVTKPVTLITSFNGEGQDPWGNKSIAFTAATRIDRKDYGLTWNKAIETGGFLVGDDVDIIIEVEANPVEAAKK